MNLNTFARHKVFDEPQMVRVIADRLANPELVKKAQGVSREGAVTLFWVFVFPACVAAHLVVMALARRRG